MINGRHMLFSVTQSESIIAYFKCQMAAFFNKSNIITYTAFQAEDQPNISVLTLLILVCTPYHVNPMGSLLLRLPDGFLLSSKKKRLTAVSLHCYSKLQ